MISVFRPVHVGPPSFPVHPSLEELTRDVEIKPIHSHNDYWRQRPLFDALSVGAQSVEGDIWYFRNSYDAERTVTETTCSESSDCKNNKITKTFTNDEIYVGHNQVYLEPNLTLNSLYLDPLFEYLSYSNIKLSYCDNDIKGTPLLEKTSSKFGVFFNSPETPLYFWLDFKTDPIETYQQLKRYLERFIDEDYLAYYDVATETFVSGPMVVTITGNIPWELIETEKKRYVFVDAPLAEFADADIKKLTRYSELAVIASGSMSDLVGGPDNFNKITRTDFADDTEISDRVKRIFDLAHSYGLKTRVWGGINWPNHIRNAHIKTLWSLGCDLVNVDDLKYASDVF